MEFDGELWQHGGDGGWFFITLPGEVAEEVRDEAPPGGGFGSVRVTAVIGESRWQTSLFPDTMTGSYVLPVKKQVRLANDLLPGDRVHVSVEVGAAGKP